MACDFNCLKCDKINEELLKLIPDELSSFEYHGCYSYPSVLTLGLTQQCNLHCPYCFESRLLGQMTLNTAKNAINFAYKNSLENKTNQCEITFFGGEPMLRYDDLIKPLLEIYQDYPIQWNMTTNGTLFNEEKINFLYKHKVNILLSFDGLKNIQDSQRPGNNFSSYDEVMKNLAFFRLRNPNSPMRATLTRKMIPFLYSTYLFAEYLGFPEFWCTPNSFEEWTKEDAINCTKELKKIAAHLYSRLIKQESKITRFHPFDTFIQHYWNIRTGNYYFNNSIFRCGMGTTAVAVAFNGDIIPCQEEVNDPRHILGNVNQNGIDKLKHKEFLLNYFQEIQKARCLKDCPKECYASCQMMLCPSRMFSNNFKIYETDCLFNKSLYMAAKPLVRLIEGSSNPMIRQFFDEPFTGISNIELVDKSDSFFKGKKTIEEKKEEKEN